MIRYIYLAPRLNWLELGYAFSSPTFLYANRIIEYLPAGFDEERQLLSQLSSPETRISVAGSIENKLGADAKNLLLFLLGKELGALKDNYHLTADEQIAPIRNLLYFTPDGISPILIKRLEDLMTASRRGDSENFYKKLQQLENSFYLLGN